jgi:LemA protein
MNWILILIFVIGAWTIVTYNRLVTLRRRCKTQWLQIDVMLKRRFELIPHLLTVVKAHQEFEQGTLEHVTQMRTDVNSASTPVERMAAESKLTAALGSLFIVAEKYPALKQEQLTAQLLDGLIDAEERIRYDRQFYNDTVVKYNTALESFPDSLVGKWFNFEKELLFGDR